MTAHLLLPRALGLAAAAAMTLLAGPALAFDYPTADRVVYVQECMRLHPGGPGYEMLNKCSCTIDRIARDVPYDDFVTMSTATDANSISGERGNYIRDTQVLQDAIKRFKALQSEAKKGCFINLDAK
jgi:hypothetical protein